MLAKRRVPFRESAADNNNYDTLFFTLPLDEAEAGICGTGQLERLEQARGLGGGAKDLYQWAAERAGMRGNEISLAPAEGDTALTELARAERETARRRTQGLTRSVIIADTDPCGRARCRITATSGMAEIVDGRLVVPLAWTYGVDWVASGILGAIYRQVIGEISLAGLFNKAELAIPGHEPVAGTLGTGLDGKPAISFPLPVKTGEGLGDDQPLERETVLSAEVIVTFNFLDNFGSVNFPVQALELPAADKPDLAAQELIIDPPMPEYGRPARLTLITRNVGCSVKADVLATASFYAQNPQGTEGWRKIFSVVFQARGWRAGEVRTFESRPLLVDGYYMNSYSYLYDPLKGDTRIRGGVDSMSQIEEGDEQNNTTELELPLKLPDDLAKPQAQDEAVKALEQPFADLLAAQTMDELQAAYGRAAAIIIPIEQQLPEIKVMGRHLMARYEIKKSSIRAKEATARLKRWQEEGGLTRERLAEIRTTLEQCELDLLNSGVPVQANALEKARNATLLANNAAGAMEDLTRVRNIAGLTDEIDGPESGGALKALDGAALLLVETNRLIEEGKADAGNLLDAATNFSEMTGVTTPGLSNLHREMLKAEVEYAIEGFDHSTNSLNIITEIIEKGESNERNAALRNSLNELDSHLSAGPFNEGTMRDMLKGWVKDIPVVGKIADVLFSWK